MIKRSGIRSSEALPVRYACDRLTPLISLEQTELSVKKVSLLFISCGIIVALFASGAIIGYRYPELFGLEPKNDIVSSGRGTSSDEALTYLMDESDGEVDFDIFWDVWELAQVKHYERNVPTDELIYGSINGVLKYGLQDDFSSFMSPDTYAKASESLGGEVGGVGLELDLHNRALTVVSTLTASEAASTGIMPGDMITSIDDEPTDGMTVLGAVSKIRGKIGTRLKLGILRIKEDGTLEDLSFDMTRSDIRSETISWSELLDGFYLIKLSNFSPNTASQWDNTVRALTSEGVKGIVLDLRSNPGGNIDAIQQIASEFIESGLIYKVDYGDGQTEEISASRDGQLYDVPLVVLINGGTASAAEMLAAALQEQHRAELVGVTSFGKGLIQKTIEVKVDGALTPAALVLSIAKWYSPDGNWVQETGIEPDIEVQTTMEQYRSGEDPVLTKAMERLQTLILVSDMEF